MLPCLGEKDPFLRDQLGYEAAAHFLRKPEQLDQALIQALRVSQNQLMAKLNDSDPDGVLHPFVVIVLAEVARTDQIHGWMKPVEQEALIDVATTYLSGISDYRAYEGGVRFRHGVAHSADLMLQLNLHREIKTEALVPFVSATTKRVVPADGSSSVTGEPGRLSRALFYLMQRAGESTELREKILESINSLGPSTPFAEWPEAFKSEAGLALRHNRRAFVEAMYIQAMPHAEHELIACYTGPLKEWIKVIP